MNGNKYVVMFVCTGNTCRSPMAQGALKVLLEKERTGKFEVISSGVSAATGFPATKYAREASKIWDCDLSGHVSQQLSPELIEKSDLILALSPEHLHQVISMVPDAKDRAYLLKNFPDPATEGEGVEDPIGQDLQKYNEVFLEIGEILGQIKDEIVKRIDEKTDG